jgi:FlaA1/EpsC-like NDP-sugar epimerase
VSSKEDEPYETVFSNVIGAEKIRCAVAEHSVEVMFEISTYKAA